MILRVPHIRPVLADVGGCVPHIPMSPASLPSILRPCETLVMQQDPESSSAEEAELSRLAEILRRVAIGDTSVTDEVFWLQMHGNFSHSRQSKIDNRK